MSGLGWDGGAQNFICGALNSLNSLIRHIGLHEKVCIFAENFKT
jgi:hypothetical protein